MRGVSTAPPGVRPRDMRWAPLLVIIAWSSTAAADGLYVTESIGGASYQGDLGRYADGLVRASIGVGVVTGPWAAEVSGTWLVSGAAFAIDCYPETESCGLATPAPELHFLSVDARRTWRILYSTWTRHIGLDLVLHGGPRRFTGDGLFDGYRGYGVGGGATVDVNLKVFSMFVDLGTDVGVLSRDGYETLYAKLPYVIVGARLGWM